MKSLAALDLNSNQINNLADPGSAQDAATQNYVLTRGFITGNQTITLSGDVTGSGSTAITTAYAGTVPATKGGTGQTAWTQGDVVYCASANTLQALAKNTSATRYLSNTGLANNPNWAQINLANGVTGLLSVANIDVSASFNFTTSQKITLTNTNTAASDSILQIVHDLSSGTAATGMGTTIWSQLENSSGVIADAGQIQNNWSTAGGTGSEVSYFDFLLRNAAALASKMRLHGSGGLSVGHTTDPLAGFISANTGFKIGSTNIFPVSTANAGLPTGGSTGQMLKKNTGTNYDTTWITPPQFDASTVAAGQNIATTTDTYITDSVVTIPAGDMNVTGATYHVVIHISKTALGTAGGPFILRIGTNGSTSDTNAASIALPAAGTAVADSGRVEFWFTVTTTGASAIVRISTFWVHNATTTGLWNSGTLATTVGGLATGSAFNATTATKIGLSYNAGTSGNHTVTVLKAEYYKK